MSTNAILRYLLSMGDLLHAILMFNSSLQLGKLSPKGSYYVKGIYGKMHANISYMYHSCTQLHSYICITYSSFLIIDDADEENCFQLKILCYIFLSLHPWPKSVYSVACFLLKKAVKSMYSVPSFIPGFYPRL